LYAPYYDRLRFCGFDRFRRCAESIHIGVHVKADDIVTRSIPTTSWATEGNYDTAWYNDADTEFAISSAAELAGLAKLVNDETDTFEGKTVNLTADIDLSAHEWVPIGHYTLKRFEGAFDGQGHTVYGAVCEDEELKSVGLFGYLHGTVRDVVVDNAYFYASNSIHPSAGGIVGYASSSDTSGDTKMTVIDNCVSYAVVRTEGYSSYEGSVGGIVGMLANQRTTLRNCVNYGSVIGSYAYAGGIVGQSANAKVLNCANFGKVTGSKCVGGVVGFNTDLLNGGFIINNYNCGTITGTTNEYIGAVVGRNQKDEGKVLNCYYLAGCAKGSDGILRNALGTSSSSVTDGDKGYTVSSFASPTSRLVLYPEHTLLSALNTKVSANTSDEVISYWAATGPNGYPLPVGIPTSAIR